jgi:hypothetical protein
MFNMVMKRWIGLTSLIVLTAMLLSIVFAGTALAQGPSPQSPGTNWGQGNMNGGWGYNGPQSMPYGYGRNGRQSNPYGYGRGQQPGMMDNRGAGWGMMGPGMMGGWGYNAPAPGSNNTTPYYGHGWDNCPYDW